MGLEETIARVNREGVTVRPATRKVTPVKLTVGGKDITPPHVPTEVETAVIGKLQKIDKLYGVGWRERHLHNALLWLLDALRSGSVPLPQ